MVSCAQAGSDLPFLRGGGELGRLIREHDWATTPLGPPEAWPQSLRSALSICLNSTFPTAIYWGPELRLLYNDAWAPIPAGRHPWALGRPAKDVWSDIWDVVGPQFAHVMESGEGFSGYDTLLYMERNGRPTETYWTYSITAIRGEDGSVTGLFNQGNETTAAVFARRRALAEVSRLGQLLEQAPGAVAVTVGPNHVFDIANHSYLALTGRKDLIGKSVAEALPEVVEQGFVTLLDRVYATGEPHVGRGVEVMLDRPEGKQTRVLDFIYQPLTDDEGNRYGIFVEATDVTDIAHYTHKLRESEEFSRSVVESSRDCIKVLDLDGTVRFMNKSGCGLMEVEDGSGSHGKPWVSMWPEESRADVEAALQAARHGETSRFSAPRPTAKGTPKWWDVMVTPVLGAGGRPVRLLATLRDITEHHAMQEARQLLTRELDHRVKNVFAIASGLVTISAANARTVHHMADVLKARLAALARAHELIGPAVRDEAGKSHSMLGQLIADIVMPHALESDKVSIEGPDVMLGPKASTGFALVFHELATNAVKYGPLAANDGRIDIRWETQGGRLVLVWREHTAHRIEPPTKLGFGTRLGDSTVSGQFGGTLQFQWDPTGLVARMNVPLERLTR